jgi:hypothetical protein
MPNRRPRKPAGFYKKPSKSWREFVEEELDKSKITDANIKQRPKNRKLTQNRFKLPLPNKFQLAAILLAIAGLLFISCRVKNAIIPKYNLTVNAVAVQQDAPASLSGNTVKIVKEDKTVAKHKLDDNQVARFTLQEGEYKVEMDEIFKGSIRVKMNMDRNVELKVAPSSN